MGGKATPIEFEAIAGVLRNSRGRIAAAGTVAQRLERALTFVQRALDRMVELKMVEVVATFRGDQYRLTDVDTRLEGKELPIRGHKRREPRDEGDYAEEGDVRGDLQKAESLWRVRMGQQRWHDDPRAVRERMQNQSVIPPFYHHAAREQ